VVLRR